MKDLKTTLLGVVQLLGASAFVVFKTQHDLPMSDAEAGLVLLAFTSGIKGLVTADAKPKDPPQ